MHTRALLVTNRRTFLKMGVSVVMASAVSNPLLAATLPEHRILHLFNIHTGESLKTCYHAYGKVIQRAVDRISRIMRDHRTGEIMPVDTNLLDLLHHISTDMESPSPINIISGYRSPRTNAALRKTTAGVARNSLHMQGRAIDIRIPGCQTSGIRRLAISLKRGGVGYYPESDFVHLDTGPVKCW